MSNKTYDILKTIQKIFVLLATFYTTIANVWGLPYGEEVSKTFLALATFLLGILEMSSVAYKQKQIADLAADTEPLEWEGEEADVDHEDTWEGEG